jgi:deoxyribonuclease I
MFRGFLSLLCWFFVISASAAPGAYYSEVQGTASKDSLFHLTSSFHYPVSYKRARELIFGFLYLEGTSSATYALETYYCNDTLTNADFDSGSQLGPMKIPDNNVVNVEHAWPQSHFTGQFSKGFQKADLHILFPTESQINSIRGNYPFGDVVTTLQAPCQQAVLGVNAAGERAFEPDDVIKGDMARAIFYFSVRYKSKVDKNQETSLRQWHEMDPPDAREIELNEKIFDIQKNRNPFIDHPEYVDQIADF